MTYYGYNDAKKRANNKYLKEKVDTIVARVPKGQKEELQALAKSHGISSLNALMCKLAAFYLSHPEILDDTEK